MVKLLRKLQYGLINNLVSVERSGHIEHLSKKKNSTHTLYTDYLLQWDFKCKLEFHFQSGISVLCGPTTGRQYSQIPFAILLDRTNEFCGGFDRNNTTPVTSTARASSLPVPFVINENEVRSLFRQQNCRKQGALTLWHRAVFLSSVFIDIFTSSSSTLNLLASVQSWSL